MNTSTFDVFIQRGKNAGGPIGGFQKISSHVTRQEAEAAAEAYRRQSNGRGISLDGVFVSEGPPPK